MTNSSNPNVTHKNEQPSVPSRELRQLERDTRKHLEKPQSNKPLFDSRLAGNPFQRFLFLSNEDVVGAAAPSATLLERFHAPLLDMAPTFDHGWPQN